MATFKKDFELNEDQLKAKKAIEEKPKGLMAKAKEDK